jgi:hypothetical protein
MKMQWFHALFEELCNQIPLCVVLVSSLWIAYFAKGSWFRWASIHDVQYERKVKQRQKKRFTLDDSNFNALNSSSFESSSCAED